MRFLSLISLVGRTAPACAGGQELIDDYHPVYGMPGVAAAVIDRSSVKTIARVRGEDDPAVEVLPEFRMAGPRHTKIIQRAGSSRPHERRSS
ncbi:hypothetical protein ACNF49_30060 [Actinomadura sp. ATCC 39365]